MDEDFDITSYLKELLAITEETKALSKKLTGLRKSKKEHEMKINEYLKAVDQPGIKYGDLIIFCEEKPKRRTKKKKEKEEDVVKLLEEAGVQNAKNFYQTMSETLKGKKEVIDSIKVKSITAKG